MAFSSTTNTSDGARSSSCPRGHWRPGEDEKLKQLVEKYGPQNWNSIAEKLEGRSGWLVSLIGCFLCVVLLPCFHFRKEVAPPQGFLHDVLLIFVSGIMCILGSSHGSAWCISLVILIRFLLRFAHIFLTGDENWLAYCVILWETDFISCLCVISLWGNNFVQAHASIGKQHQEKPHTPKWFEHESCVS